MNSPTPYSADQKEHEGISMRIIPARFKRINTQYGLATPSQKCATAYNVELGLYSSGVHSLICVVITAKTVKTRF